MSSLGAWTACSLPERGTTYSVSIKEWRAGVHERRSPVCSGSLGTSYAMSHLCAVPVQMARMYVLFFLTFLKHVSSILCRVRFVGATSPHLNGRPFARWGALR